MSTNKYFPIKTATACQLKWTWSTIWLSSGMTASCHRIIPENIGLDEFDNFHNTAKKLNDRELMLDGKWPTGGCEYCQQIEQTGGSSDRMFHLSIPNLAPPELDNNITAISVTPKILEVYLNNICNFSCLYCGGMNSSQIAHENKQYSDFVEQRDYKDRFTTFQLYEENNQSLYMDKFIKWMEQNSTSLTRLHILGGEPFYQKEFNTLLDFLEKYPNPQLEFNIVTNLGITQKKLISYMERIKQLVIKKKIRRLEMTCSIDCWGPEQEFVRNGINLAQWEINFNYLLDQKWIVLNINQTISGLTIKTMPALLIKLKEWKLTRSVGHFFSMVTPSPSYLKPNIFFKNMFDDDFKKIISLMNDDTWQEKEAKKYMNGVWKQISTDNENIEEIENLKIFLNEIDRRRNTNWRTLFPWLAEYKYAL